MSDKSKALKLNITPLGNDDAEISDHEGNLTGPNLNTTNADEVFTPTHRLTRSPTRPRVHASTPLPTPTDVHRHRIDSETNRIIVTRARQRAISLEDGLKGLEFELGIGNSQENSSKPQKN